MIYGYLRVSTDKQDLQHQKAAVLSYANDKGMGKVTFIEETISSRRKDRAIFSLIGKLNQGDTLIIFELSRLARSMAELESIRVKVSDAGATIHAISQKLVISPGDNDISTKALIFALELSAQIERQMISDRTRSALQAKKAAGAVLGRPPGQSKLDSYKDDISGYLDKGLNLTAISKLIGCNRQTLANWLGKNDFNH